MHILTNPERGFSCKFYYNPFRLIIFSLFASLSGLLRNGHPLTLSFPPPSTAPKTKHHRPQHARNPLPTMPNAKQTELVDW